MLIIWLVMIVLVVAVAVMFRMLLKKQEHQIIDEQLSQQLEHKVQSLELNLHKTLEIVDLFHKSKNDLPYADYLYPIILNIHA